MMTFFNCLDINKTIKQIQYESFLSDERKYPFFTVSKNNNHWLNSQVHME